LPRLSRQQLQVVNKFIDFSSIEVYPIIIATEDDPEDGARWGILRDFDYEKTLKEIRGYPEDDVTDILRLWDRDSALYLFTCSSFALGSGYKTRSPFYFFFLF